MKEGIYLGIVFTFKYNFYRDSVCNIVHFIFIGPFMLHVLFLFSSYQALAFQPNLEAIKSTFDMKEGTSLAIVFTFKCNFDRDSVFNIVHFIFNGPFMLHVLFTFSKSWLISQILKAIKSTFDMKEGTSLEIVFTFKCNFDRDSFSICHSEPFCCSYCHYL